MSSKEILRPAFSDQDEPRISFGPPFAETCRKHVEETFKACRVYIIASGSLARSTSNVKDLQNALRGKVAGVRIGMKPHTFMSEVLETIHDARRVDADLIVTIGGGSLTDAAKLIAFALGNDVHSEIDLMTLPHISNPTAAAKPPKCPVICIPTSLSGGEYSDFAGVTRDSDHQKFQFSHPLKGPRLIILDADLTVATPLRVWIASGVRAVDHCVESFTNLKRDDEADAACIEGLKCLVPALLITVSDPQSAKARHDAQLGVSYSMVPLHRRVLPGASHGIGHMLGPLGVSHGETSCILLPFVCKWNAKYNANVERQAMAVKVLWDIGVAREKFESRGLKEETADLGDLIDVIVREFRMPRSLAEVGVGRDKFDALAVNSLEDSCCKANPIPMQKKEQVMEILEMAA